MLIVNCALRQDDIIEIVENIEIENEKPFKFSKKQGLQIHFDSTSNVTNEVCALVKKVIKETPVGKTLFFNVASK